MKHLYKLPSEKKMTGQSPWSIKGIKSGNREAVKEQAHRNGLTIGEYINSLIEEAEQGKSSAKRPIYEPVFDPNNQYVPQAEYKPSALSEFGLGAPQYINNDTSRLAMAMEALHHKLDTFANYNGPKEIIAPSPNIKPNIDEMAIAEKATERAISSILQKVEDNEHNASRNIGQLNSTLNDVRQAQETISERIRRLEADDPSHRSIQSLRVLEQSLTRLSKQISDTEMRTDAIVREIESEKKNRLTPQDVEKILEGSVSKIKENINEKIGEVSGRISSIEEIATISIEQTDKGINLLSERVKDAELLSNRTNETLKEALVDLSARITQIEIKSPDQINNALEAQFSGLVKRIEEIDNQFANFVHNAHKDIEEKFASLADNFEERFVSNEKETLSAIENIGSHLVRSAEGLDARVKAIEEVNENAKDHHMAMRIELGRITHAIDSRLSAIENRDADGLGMTGEHINKLAEQVTNRLHEVEQKSNNFMQKIADENRVILEKINNTNPSSDFNLKLEEFDRKINQRLDDRFGAINYEIKSSEDRARAVSEPLNRSLNEIIERLDNMENRNLAPYSETISPPNYLNTYDAAKPVPSNGEALDKSFGFGSGSTQFEESNEEITFVNPEDEPDPFAFDEDQILSQKDNSYNDDYGISEELSEPIFDITGAEAEDQDQSDWNNPKQNDQKSENDYLIMARRAAIDAANSVGTANKQKKPKPEKKPIPKPSVLNPEPLIQTEAIFDEEIKISTKSKTKAGAAQPLSPLGKVALGALAVATISTGYIYFNQSKPVDQNELPASLKNQQPAAPAPVAPPVVNAATDANMVAANAVNAVATLPTNSIAPVVTNQTAAAPIAAPIKELKPAPLAPVSPQIAKPVAEQKAPTTEKKSFIPINPFKNYAKPVPPPTQIAANPQPVRIANVGDIAAKPAAVKQLPPKPAPLKVDVKALYDQALLKQKAGDSAGAVALLTRAADAGDTRSQNRLAKMYEKGDGVTKSMMEARKWTERAASAGSKQAQHNLGVYYAEGDGASQDFVKAADNFKKAAKRGLTDSQFNLGAMHEQGLGTTKSASDAYFWYSLAAKNGDSDALKKANEISAKIDPKEKAATDRKVAAFKPEAGGQE